MEFDGGFCEIGLLSVVGELGITLDERIFDDGGHLQKNKITSLYFLKHLQSLQFY